MYPRRICGNKEDMGKQETTNKTKTRILNGDTTYSSLWIRNVERMLVDEIPQNEKIVRFEGERNLKKYRTTLNGQ